MNVRGDTFSRGTATYASDTGTVLNPGGFRQAANMHDRIAKTRSVFVRERDRDDPVRLAVNVTGWIIADRDRGITGDIVHIHKSFIVGMENRPIHTHFFILQMQGRRLL